MFNSLYIVYITCTYIYTYTRTSIPAYWIAQMADRRSGRNIHTPTPAYWIADRRSGRNTQTHPCLPDLHEWQIAGQGEIYTRLPLPTRYARMADHRSGRNIHTPTPAYQIAQLADRRSGRNTQTHPCLPDLHEWQIASQGEIYTHAYPCLPDRTNGRSPVREKYTNPSLPTRSHEWQIAGQGEIYTHLPLPTGSLEWQIAGQGKIHKPIPAYQICTNGRSPVREKYTQTHPCLLDSTNGRSPVREKYTHVTLLQAYIVHTYIRTLGLHVLLKSISRYAVAGLTITPSLQYTLLTYADCATTPSV